MSGNNLSIVYYTANVISDYFAQNTFRQLVKATNDLPIIVVSKKPMLTNAENIVVDLPRHHLNIYRQALIGAKTAKTKFIALCEDDVLYSPEHFKHRSNPGKFAYNLGTWNIFTWSDPPMYTHKGNGRVNLGQLICERDLFIEAMEERFAKWSDDSQINLSNWAEPGKYEKHLGVTLREIETFYTNPANIIFSHEKALAFENLGVRKKLGEIRAYRIPYWGDCRDILKLYKE